MFIFRLYWTDRATFSFLVEARIRSIDLDSPQQITTHYFRLFDRFAGLTILGVGGCMGSGANPEKFSGGPRSKKLYVIAVVLELVGGTEPYECLAVTHRT